jgi:aryl-alcohol dehydrogenase-like predicted oxidoreductase
VAALPPDGTPHKIKTTRSRSTAVVLADAKDCTPGQIALAWLLAQQPWIVPIPGTRRRERVIENAGAAAVALSADEVAALDTLAERVGVKGNRYNDQHMALVER